MKAPTLWKIATKFDTGFNIVILISKVMYCATLLVAFWPAAAAAAAGLAIKFAQARKEMLTAAASEQMAKEVGSLSSGMSDLIMLLALCDLSVMRARI